MERLLTIEEVSDLTGIAVPTLYSYRTNGGGPTAVKLGRRLRYKPSDVEAWVDSKREARTPQPEVPRRRKGAA